MSVVPGSVGYMTCCLLYIIGYGWTGTVWKRCPHNVNGQYNPIATGIERTSVRDKEETDLLRTVYERTSVVLETLFG